MRVLLDGCVPKHLAKELSVHEVQTVPEMGWGDLDDGPLLDVMAGRFNVLYSGPQFPDNHLRWEPVRNRGLL